MNSIFRTGLAALLALSSQCLAVAEHTNTFAGSVFAAAGSMPSESVASVNGIAAFCALPDGTEATLYLSPDAQARVTCVAGGQVYLRDVSGSLCLEGLPQTSAMAYNQHWAGFLTGQKTSTGSMPVFKGTEHTNLTRLAMAEPVTEPNVEPVTVTAGELSGHLANWVTVRSLVFQDSETGQDATGRVHVVNALNTAGYEAPAAGSSWQVSGIVVGTAAGTHLLCPIANEAMARRGNPDWTQLTSYPAMTTATGIRPAATVQPLPETVYDLAGRRVGTARMNKGIYIVKGKKYVY